MEDYEKIKKCWEKLGKAKTVPELCSALNEVNKEVSGKWYIEPYKNKRDVLKIIYSEMDSQGHEINRFRFFTITGISDFLENI